MHESSLLDSTVLASLVELNAQSEGDFLVGLVERYADLGATMEGEMDAALAERDRDAIRRLAHQFKGSSANLGVKQVSDICHEIQTWADGAEDFTVARGHVNCLREARRAGTDALREFVRHL